MSFLKNFIVVPAGIWQVPIIKILKKKKFNVYTLDDDALAIGHSYGKKNLKVRTNNIKKLKKFCNENKCKVISLSSDFGLNIKNQIENNKKLPNKLEQRKIQKKLKLNYPKFGKIGNFKKTYITKNKSFIIKPVSGSGSKNISEINLSKKNKDFKNNYNKNYIFEEKIEGTEFIYDGFCYNGKVYNYIIGKKIKLKKQFVTHVIHSTKISNNIKKKMNRYAEIFLNSLNFFQGPFHIEFMIQKNSKKLYMVETNFRGIGFDIYSKMIKKISGVDVLQKQIEIELQKKIKTKTLINKKLYNNFCFRLIPIKKNGKIKNIKFKKIKIIKDVILTKKLFFKKNDIVEAKKQDSSRFGYIYLLSKNNKINLIKYSDKILKNYFSVKYYENN